MKKILVLFICATIAITPLNTIKIEQENDQLNTPLKKFEVHEIPNKEYKKSSSDYRADFQKTIVYKEDRKSYNPVYEKAVYEYREPEYEEPRYVFERDYRKRVAAYKKENKPEDKTVHVKVIGQDENKYNEYNQLKKENGKNFGDKI